MFQMRSNFCLKLLRFKDKKYSISLSSTQNHRFVDPCGHQLSDRVLFSFECVHAWLEAVVLLRLLSSVASVKMQCSKWQCQTDSSYWYPEKKATLNCHQHTIRPTRHRPESLSYAGFISSNSLYFLPKFYNLYQ